MSKETIQALTNLRVRLNSVEKSIITLPKTRYSSLAATSLEVGRMWIGEICRELGKEYPYEATKSATTPDGIQPAVDLAEGDGYLLGVNEIINLNILRDDLERYTVDLMSVVSSDDFSNEVSDEAHDVIVFMTAVASAYQGLKEARMWLGKRLGEIRDQANEKASSPTLFDSNR